MHNQARIPAKAAPEAAFGRIEVAEFRVSVSAVAPPLTGRQQSSSANKNWVKERSEPAGLLTGLPVATRFFRFRTWLKEYQGRCVAEVSACKRLSTKSIISGVT